MRRNHHVKQKRTKIFKLQIFIIVHFHRCADINLKRAS